MHKIITLDQKPGLKEQVDRLSQEAWPEFLLHGDARFWGSLFDIFAAFQILFLEPDEKLIAVGHTVPLTWDGTVDHLPPTIDGILVRANQDRANHQTPTALCALAAMIDKSHQGKGLSSQILKAMRAKAREHGLDSLIAPVRPSLKSRYPLTPFERYVGWTRPDGAPFDPWMRVHWRLGAKQLSIAENTLTVRGTVAEWEKWTGMVFPESGQYVVDGALQPIHIDRDRDEGLYEDPNIWMHHQI